MTDEDILHRLFVLKDLRINPRTAVVESKNDIAGNPSSKWRALKQVPDKHDSGYRFVSVSFGGRKKKIGVHVLQWMAANRRTVPDGYDVHHKKSPERPHPKPNNIDNLELLESSVNQSMNYVPF